MPKSTARPVSTFHTVCTRHPETIQASGRSSSNSFAAMISLAGLRKVVVRNSDWFMAVCAIVSAVIASEAKQSIPPLSPDGLLRFARNDGITRYSMHRSKKPREAKARHPGPDRLAADAHVPGADNGIGAADQIVDRQ